MAIKFKLAEVRKAKKVSQYRLAKEMGMSIQNVQHLEKKVKLVSLETLDNICMVLHCTPADLFEFVPSADADAS